MINMRWEAQWTLLLFGCATILYGIVQVNTRSPSTLLQSATDSVPADTPHTRPDLGATFQTFEGVQMAFEVPTNPKAVLLLFHGCQHSCTDWWPKSGGCPTCTGLPEEVRITEAAVGEGFAVVALSSQDRTHNRCWDTGWPPQHTADIPKVTWAFQALVKQQGWSELPLYALGASSGGALVLLLALRFPFQNPPEDDAGNTWQYPPTAFTYMARDQHTAHGVQEMTSVLVQQGVKVLNMEVQPRALSPTFLSNRTKDISQSVSAAIFSTFQKAGLLDYADFLLDDPRQTSAQWQGLLKQHVPATKQMSLKHDESAVHEELNLAWAGHELISDNISTVFEFFQSQSPH